MVFAECGAMQAMEQKINAQKQMAERKKAAVRHDVYEASDEKQLWKAKLQGTGAVSLSPLAHLLVSDEGCSRGGAGHRHARHVRRTSSGAHAGREATRQGA